MIRLIALCLGSLLSFSLCSQLVNDYYIKGVYNGFYSDTRIDISNLETDSNEIFKTTFLKDSTFLIQLEKESFDEQQGYILSNLRIVSSTGNQLSQLILLSKDTLHLEIDSTERVRIVNSTSPLQKQFNFYVVESVDSMTKYQGLLNEFAQDSLKLLDVQNSITQFVIRMVDSLKSDFYISQGKEKIYYYFVLGFLNELIDLKEFDFIEKVCASSDGVLPKIHQKRICNATKMKKLNIGDDVPELARSDINFDQKVVFIDFWASWCGPCIKELPYLKAIHQKIKKQKVEFVSISVDKSEKSWKKRVHNEELNEWLQLIDQDKNFQYEFGVRAVPSNYLIDNGKIIAKNISMLELQQYFKENSLINQ